MLKKKLAAVIAAVMIVSTISSTAAFAEPMDSSSADADISAYTEEPQEYFDDGSSSADDLNSEINAVSETPADISSAAVSKVSNMEYTGAEIKPAVTVTLNGAILTEGTDYTIEYLNNTEPGTASIVVTGTGVYTGRVTVNFNIVMPVQSAVSKIQSKNNTVSSYTITWSSAKNATGYELYRYNSGTQKWDKIKTTSELKYEVKGKASATKDYYCIRAYRKIGSRTIYSEYTRLNTSTLPDQVTGLKIADVSTSGYTLKWSKVKGAESYQVYLYDKYTKTYNLYKTVKTNSAAVTGRQPGQKNTFKVYAVVSTGGKDYKSVYQKAQFTSKPGKVTGFKCSTTGKGYITFKWNAVNNASRYQIYYADKKDGPYTLLKEVSGKQTSLKTGLAPTGRKLYFKMRAVSVIGNCRQAGTCSSKIRGIAFNKLSINSVLKKYSNSRTVKQINAQGYKLSSYNQNRLYTALTSLGGDAGYLLYDIDSGTAVAYNADTYFGTASTVKMPYVLYCLREMEDGNPTMSTKLTYKPSDYNGGSSWIKYQPFYTQYTIKRVIELIGEYSDNCGYYMMQDYFGYDGYNKFIQSLGCKPSVNSSVRWGYVSACDSAREWNNMWDYLKHGRYAAFARRVFSTTCAGNIRDQLGNRYRVYEKSGWTDTLYNETALVRAEHPYIVICLSNRTSAQRMRNVAEISESIHNEIWNYYN